MKRHLYLLSLITALILTMALSAFQSLNPASTVTPQPTATLASFNSETTLTSTVALDLALHPIEHNADWTPYFQAFDGYPMALVPVGCFMMGSDTDSDDEKPVNQQCFDQPFWIDRYEVTNQQYGSEGYFKGDNRPRESINWFAARDFCAQRGTRLPTEREWEYAARGPSNFVYPWGNEFIADNVVYSNNANSQTADVGSRPTGDSWVGASDLSGNVWEWVGSIYQPYPYKTDDGREVDSDSINILRGLRGSSWDFNELNLRASFRSGNLSANEYYDIGFRCVRLS